MPHDAGRPMTLVRLRWLAIIAPVLVLAAVWLMLHSGLEALHDFPGVLLLLGLLAVAVALFAFGIFSTIERLEGRIVRQNVELERANRELAALLAVGRAASSSLELEAVVEAALDAARSVAGADAAEVWLAAGAGELELVGVRGAGPGRRGERIADDGAGARAQRMAEGGLPSSSLVPLTHRGERLGALVVAAQAAGRLRAEHEIRLLEGIAERVAPAIAIARLHEGAIDAAVVDERLRLARELHDGLAQVLGYINTQTLAVRKLLSSGRPDEAQEELAAMQAAARDVYADIREAILGLRVALPRDGFIPGIGRYVEGYGAMAGAEVRLETHGDLDGLALAPSAEIQVVRIIQEALANIRKHAGAAHARVRMRLEDGTLVVEVSDDGRGFDPGATPASGWPRFGLQTMRERAVAVGGTFDVASRPGAGTTVRVSVPTRHEAADARPAR
ncbi:GAF domain-containing sensor histidine kinase [Miltoncostaea marina]|uniref:GAF domain-containing sensor histidine kinase n=1 Tax=Miltoncostaea marina TaxID=2843215 RepID=UPI001C3CE848|nr:GAF domain-containing sensor histidine kinase [Miltoncostaea marina]